MKDKTKKIMKKVLISTCVVFGVGFLGQFYESKISETNVQPKSMKMNQLKRVNNIKKRYDNPANDYVGDYNYNLLYFDDYVNVDDNGKRLYFYNGVLNIDKGYTIKETQWLWSDEVVTEKELTLYCGNSTILSDSLIVLNDSVNYHYNAFNEKNKIVTKTYDRTIIRASILLKKGQVFNENVTIKPMLVNGNKPHLNFLPNMRYLQESAYNQGYDTCENNHNNNQNDKGLVNGTFNTSYNAPSPVLTEIYFDFKTDLKTNSILVQNSTIKYGTQFYTSRDLGTSYDLSSIWTNGHNPTINSMELKAIENSDNKVSLLLTLWYVNDIGKRPYELVELRTSQVWSESKAFTFTCDFQPFILNGDESFNLGFESGKVDGYKDGYKVGYDEGVTGNFSPFSWLNSLTELFDGIFNIELFKGFTIGGLVLIPVIFLLVSFILGLFNKGGK